MTPDQVAAAILVLPLRLRRPFVMAHVEGKSREEIATQLRISTRCVERRLTRALVRCREQLQLDIVH